jgi:hypothetical protein
LNFPRFQTRQPSRQNKHFGHLRWAAPTLLISVFIVTAWWLSDREHGTSGVERSFQVSSEPMRWKLEFEPSDIT